jgi:hypothetical protein
VSCERIVGRRRPSLKKQLRSVASRHCGRGASDRLIWRGSRRMTGSTKASAEKVDLGVASRPRMSAHTYVLAGALIRDSVSAAFPNDSHVVICGRYRINPAGEA